jgi:hypothetical protein
MILCDTGPLVAAFNKADTITPGALSSLRKTGRSW